MATTAEKLAAAQTMLDAVDAAILRIVGGAQSVTVNGNQYNFANLARLREIRADLQAEVDGYETQIATEAATSSTFPRAYGARFND